MTLLTSCPFSRALASRSRPCEHGARYRACPSALRLPPRWQPRVPQRQRDARPRPPKGARCASGSDTPGPSARGAAASSAALHSQNTAPRTTCPRRAARRSHPPCAPRWRSRCAAPFRCAWPRASACTSASAKRLAPSARGSDPSPDAPFAATSLRSAPARAPQSMHAVSARQPWLMPSAPRVLPLARRLLLVPVPRRSEEHTSELQSHLNLVCRLLLEKKKRIAEPSAREE